MDHDLIKQVTTVKKNIDLQLEDLLFRREKVEVELYYDTSDVHDAVLGYRVFYPPFSDRFANDKFNSQRTLVHSLVASGWLGKIRLLPPHQAEFLTRLKFYFGVDIAMDPKGDARDFLRDSGLERVKPMIDAPADSFKKDAFAFIKRQAGLAEKLFKASQCLVPWHRRLARWEARKLLDFETEKPRYDELIHSEDFLKLKDEFDNRRPNSPVNNFADAMAATILIQQLNDVGSGSKRMSRFYVPSELFQEVLEETGVSAHLNYIGPLGHESTVLCDSDYFVYKAAFTPRVSRNGESEAQAWDDAEKYLQDLSDKVAPVLGLRDKLTSGLLKEIKDLTGKPLSEIMEDLQQFSFIENVWLNYQAPQDMNFALRELVEASRDLTQSAGFQHKMAKVIRVTEARLSENVEEFRWISTIWLRVQNAAKDLRARVRVGSSSSEEFFRDLGLFRYGFPEETHDNIRNLLQEIISGEKSETAARISVISAAYRGRKDPRESFDRLITAAAVMLAFRMYRELYSLLNRIKDLPHSSLKVVLCEILLRLRKRKERCLDLVNQLEDQLRTEERPTIRADLSVGIAYLYFRLWRAIGGKHRIHSEEKEKAQMANAKKIPPHPINPQRLYVGKAINYARAAYEIYDDEQMMKKVYALNQWLYYMIENDDKDQLRDIEEGATQLSEYRSESELWQYRFDDTLSRYFQFKASSAQTTKEWEELMNEAKRLSDDALAESNEDEDVKQHATQLSMVKARGFKST